MTVGHNKGPMGHTNMTHIDKNDGYPMETIDILNENYMNVINKLSVFV